MFTKFSLHPQFWPEGSSLSSFCFWYQTHISCEVRLGFFCLCALHAFQFSSVQSLSRVRLCDPMDHSTPGLPVHHRLSEFTQTHVHWVGDAIQSSHPLLSPSPPAFNLSQHQGLFKWVSSLHQVAKELEFQLQFLPSFNSSFSSFQWTPRTDLL